MGLLSLSPLCISFHNVLFMPKEQVLRVSLRSHMMFLTLPVLIFFELMVFKLLLSFDYLLLSMSVVALKPSEILVGSLSSFTLERVIGIYWETISQFSSFVMQSRFQMWFMLLNFSS